jgi:hypothetical protein
LKKRTKKLLSVSGSDVATHGARRRRAIGMSFLLLFFKKEDLYCSLSCRILPGCYARPFR